MFTKHILEYVKAILPTVEGNYLEIGVYDGESIGTLGKDFPDKTIFAVDPFIEDGNTSWTSGISIGNRLNSQRESTYNFIKDKSNVKLFEVMSHDFYTSLTDDKIRDYNIQIVFIDGDHHYDHVTNDYKLALSLIGSKSGIIIFDDDYIPDVNRAIDEFKFINGSRIVKILDLTNSSWAYEIKAI
jgi:hypothetical protein